MGPKKGWGYKQRLHTHTEALAWGFQSRDSMQTWDDKKRIGYNIGYPTEPWQTHCSSSLVDLTQILRNVQDQATQLYG